MLQTRERTYAVPVAERHFVRIPNFRKTNEERLEEKAAKLIHKGVLLKAGLNPKTTLNTSEAKQIILNALTIGKR